MFQPSNIATRRKRTADDLQQHQLSSSSSSPRRGSESKELGIDQLAIGRTPSQCAGVHATTRLSLSSSLSSNGVDFLPSHIVADRNGFFSFKALPPKSRTKKKRRTVPPLHLQEKIPLEHLPQLVVENIVSFVDSTQDLQMLVSTVKTFRQAIISRPDIVIRAGVFSGGTVKLVTEDLVINHIKPRNIYIPSTSRLLRLLNAVRCERGSLCYKYNADTGKSKKLTGTMLKKRPFGLCLCGACFDDMTLHMSNLRQTRRFSEMGFFSHPLLSITSGNRMQRIPMTDLATSEHIGCLITAAKISQLGYTYWYRPDSPHNSNTSTADDAALEQSTGAGRNSSSSSSTSTSSSSPSSFSPMTDKEAYSVTLLMISKLAQDARRLVGRNADKTTDGTGSGSTHAGLSCSISDNNSHRIDDIVSAFEDAKMSYPEFIKSKQALLVKKDELDKEQKKRRRAKARGGAAVWQMIIKLVLSAAQKNGHDDNETTNTNNGSDIETDQSDHMKKAKKFFEDYSWLFDHSFDKKGLCRFSIKIVDSFLGPVCRAPTTATKRKMMMAICGLIPNLNKLQESGFLPKSDYHGDDVIAHDWPFLDTSIPAEEAIWKFLKDKVTAAELLSRSCTGSGRQGEEFWRHLEEQKPANAVYRALLGDRWAFDAQSRSALFDKDIRTLFAVGVALEYDDAVDDDEKVKQYLCVANTVWLDSEVLQVNLSTLDAYEADYTRLRDDFLALMSSIQTYMASTQTRSFLADLDDPLAGAEQTFSRLDALNSMFGSPGLDQKAKVLLTSRNYEALLAYHREIYSNPLRFGLDLHCR